MGTTRPGTYGTYVPVLADLVKLVSQDIPAMQASVEGRLAEVAAGVATDVASANTTAGQALTKATAANTLATSANTTAGAASTAAANAVTTANDAKTTANGIAATAQAADTKATAAVSTAGDALSVAQSSTSATMSRGNVARDTDGVPYLIPAVIAPPLTGAGSPMGVVTPAAPGQEYTDANGTNGAWKWLSTGTTKTSWVVIAGDTGWRSFGAELTNGFATATPCYVRREGGSVFILGRLNATAATADAFWSAPSGFQFALGSHVIPMVSGALTLRTGTFTAETTSRIASWYFMWQWGTTDPWPTTLPGTPA